MRGPKPLGRAHENRSLADRAGFDERWSVRNDQFAALSTLQGSWSGDLAAAIYLRLRPGWHLERQQLQA